MSASGARVGKVIDIPTDDDVRERYIHYLASEKNPEMRSLEFDAWLKAHDNKVRQLAHIDFVAEQKAQPSREEFLDELIEEALDLLDTPPDFTQVLDTHGGRSLWKAHVAAQAREHLASGHKKSMGI